MTQKTLAQIKHETTQFGDEICLQYYLITDQLCFDGAQLDSYGIEVVLHRPGSDLQESSTVHHITTRGATILNMLLTVANQTVTPCTLKQTVLDLL